MVIGSSTADTGWDQKWRLQQPVFSGQQLLWEEGAAKPRRACGAHSGRPESGQRLAKPDRSIQHQALATPPCHLQAPRRGWAASGGACSRRPRGWKGARAAENGTEEISPGPPSRAHRSTGSGRLPFALREQWKAGPALLSPQPPIRVSAPRKGPPGRATTKLCLGSSERHPVKLGEVPDPSPLKSQSWRGVFLPRSWWPDFLFPPQGRKDQWDNLRERTKLAPPRPLKEPGRLPSPHSRDYLEGWNFLLIFLNKIFFLATTF